MISSCSKVLLYTNVLQLQSFFVSLLFSSTLNENSLYIFTFFKKMTKTSKWPNDHNMKFLIKVQFLFNHVLESFRMDALRILLRFHSSFNSISHKLLLKQNFHQFSNIFYIISFLLILTDHVKTQINFTSSNNKEP